MIAKLYHTRPPDGRALSVAKAIGQVAPSMGKKALLVASDLFSCVHPEAKAAIIEIEDQTKLEKLEEVCAECGISVSTAEMPQ